MSETQWAVEHFGDSGLSLEVIRQESEAEARAVVANCNRYGGGCRVLRREVPDWSYADDAPGVVS